MTLRALAAALACVAAVAGCGGSDDAGPDTPKPAETIEQFQARLKTAVAAIGQNQCEAVARFDEKAGLPLQCDANAKKLFAGFQIVGAKAYGSGGVVEFKAAQVPQGVGAYTVAIGEDGKYQITGPVAPVLPASAINTKPKDPDKMDEAAEDMVEAIRENNCDKFLAAVYVPPELQKAQACKQELTDAYSQLRMDLAADKDAKPERIDGNDRFMFYALETGDQFRTLVVTRTGQGANRPFVGFVTFRGPPPEKS